MNRGKRSGFTLIELVMTVAVLAILTVIAVPSYLKYVRESHRSAAKTALLDLASREEQYFSTNNVYGSLADLGYANIADASIQVPSASEDYYRVAVTLRSSATGYTATAEPQGAQADDSCGTYQLNDLGAQTNSSTSSGVKCW
jgi:type IV pilus assembly protein PilE